MITVQEQKQVRLLSDTDLYPQAVQFMRGVARPLPQTQINGLINVSLDNTYDVLMHFIEKQRTRTSWRREDSHIPDFYHRLAQKLKQLETSALQILKVRTEQATREDMQTLKILLAREFIQHLLAENGYMLAEKTIQQDEQRQANTGRPQGRNPGPVRQQGRP